ncbi:unnamed protein product [Urochloa decumbens]|uniref:Uncharacterized protein n=1 Tax=Urochloa decumbens TaxID=240449 RepID=A0ABC9AQ80_9POAL
MRCPALNLYSVPRIAENKYSYRPAGDNVTMSRSPACPGHSIGSASTASAETVAVLHELRLEDYSQTCKGHGNARHIKSSFVAGGHSWSITFFSDGGRYDNTEWICFLLCLEHRGTVGDVMVRIKYSFLDEVGEPIPSSSRRTTDSLCTFRRTGQSWAESRLIKREHMESSYLKDDKVCIRCDVTVIEVTSISAVVPPSDLFRDLAGLLVVTGVGAGVKFKVGSETLAAQKDVTTATGWHIFKVEGYSQMKGIGAARRIKSPSFLAGGHSWCITFFPDGSSQETSEWICFGLRLENRGTDGDVLVRAKYSFLDEVGEPIPSSTRTTDSLWRFERTGHSWTFSPSFKREDMESLYVTDDKLYIRCDVTVIHVACHQMSAVAPPSDLHRHLADLLATGAGADVTFDVGGETFAAHKEVLAARSPVFKAEFFGGPVKENVEARPIIRIDGIEPGVFEAMLHFIYTDALPKIDHGDQLVIMAQHLLVAADRYNIESLVSVCEFTLCLFIDRSVVESTLVLAEQHGCHGLKEACFKFLKSSDSYREVLDGDDLDEHLASTCPSHVDELCTTFDLCDLFETEAED